MDKDWILQTNDTRRSFANSTWVPLRESRNEVKGDVKEVGYVSQFFGCGSVAFPPENREIAEKLSWSEIGLGHHVEPYAFNDGEYKTIDQYQYHDKETIGVELVFEHIQPVVGGRLWILNPDIIVALRLIKQDNSWVRPEENFIEVVREVIDAEGEHKLIEIKREFLIDYLAARNLSLRLSYYRQRVENVEEMNGVYEDLENKKESRDGGRFEVLIRSLEDVFGGDWAMLRLWRTDVDENADAPIMGPDNNDNTGSESSRGYKGGFKGIRVESEFWRDEWIDHEGHSIRVRGDANKTLPNFIIETDGKRISSVDLNNEDIGRWLWFRASVIIELLNLRGFSLIWYTAETGGIKSTSGYITHFGINSSDLITVYAYDIARLDSWEQHIWAAHNVVPDGKVSIELLASQVKSQPASTHAVEEMFFKSMRQLQVSFRQNFKINLFTQDINDEVSIQNISRFISKDQTSLLRLAKELIRLFSDRLNINELRTLSTHAKKNELGSNKLLEDILAQKIGPDKAREIFGVIAGTYDMRVGDAHPTGSKIENALKLAEIDKSKTLLRQGEQLIHNFGRTIFLIENLLFEPKENNVVDK